MEHPERSCTTCQTDVPTGALTCPFCGAYIPEAFELDDNNDTALAGLLPTPVGEPVVQLPPPTAEEAAAEAAPVRWPAVARAEFEPPRVLVTVPEPPRLLVTVPETPRVLSTEPEPESESPRSERPEPESPSPEAEFVEAAATTVGIEDAEGDVFDPSALVVVETDLVVEAPDLVVVDDQRTAEVAAWAPPSPPPAPTFSSSELGLPHVGGAFDLPYAEDDPDLEPAGGRWWGRRRS